MFSPLKQKNEYSIVYLYSFSSAKSIEKSGLVMTRATGHSWLAEDMIRPG